MESANSLLLLPANVPYTEESISKPRRKVLKYVFMFLFAVYLVSTLLGAALVPGRLELDGISFSRSVAEYGAPFLCVERCFFALFLLFLGFTAFRIPISLFFVMFCGTYSGVCIRLLLYNGSPLISISLSLLFSFQLLCDVFLSCLPFALFRIINIESKYKKFFIYLFSFIVYFFVTYSLSLFISLMLK